MWASRRLMRIDPRQLKVAELKCELTALSQPTSGKKEELVERLVDAITHLQVAAEFLSIGFVGPAPEDMHENIPQRTGLFRRRDEDCDERPSYAHCDSRNDTAMWYSSGHWRIGKKEKFGSGTSSLRISCHVTLPQNITGTWKVLHKNNSQRLDSENIKVQVPPVRSSGDDEEVAFVGERSRAERDADGRKRAIDVESESARKQARAAFETRVATARSLCSAAADSEYRALTKPACDAYMADEIDEEELKKRKAAARAQAEARKTSLVALDAAFDAYLAVTKEHTAKVATCSAAVDEAKAKLDAAESAFAEAEQNAECAMDAALHAVEKPAADSGGAGPSGVIKSESVAAGEAQAEAVEGEVSLR